RRITPAADRRTGVAHPRSKPGNLMAVWFSFSPTGSPSIICLHGSITAAPGRSPKPATRHTGSPTPATPDRQAKAPGARPMSTDEAQRCADQGSSCLPPHLKQKPDSKSVMDRCRWRENPQGNRRDDHWRVDVARPTATIPEGNEFGTCNRTGAAGGDPGG